MIYHIGIKIDVEKSCDAIVRVQADTLPAAQQLALAAMRARCRVAYSEDDIIDPSHGVEWEVESIYPGGLSHEDYSTGYEADLDLTAAT